MKQFLTEGSITLSVYLSRITDLYKFEPKRKYVEELLDTDESDATSDDDDSSSSSSTDSESDNNEDIDLNNDEVVNNANVEVEAPNRNPVPANVQVIDKIPCDICGKYYTARGMNTHKATHKNRN